MYVESFRYSLGMHQFPCIDNLAVVDGNVNQYSYTDLIGGNLLEPIEQMLKDQQHPFVFHNRQCDRAMTM